MVLELLGTLKNLENYTAQNLKKEINFLPHSERG
jgi:hypothetical protein